MTKTQPTGRLQPLAGTQGHGGRIKAALASVQQSLNEGYRHLGIEQPQFSSAEEALASTKTILDRIEQKLGKPDPALEGKSISELLDMCEAQLARANHNPLS